jgi:hypothetical protein
MDSSPNVAFVASSSPNVTSTRKLSETPQKWQRGKQKKSSAPSALSALYAQKLEHVPLNIYVFSLSKCLHQNLLRDSLH